MNAMKRMMRNSRMDRELNEELRRFMSIISAITDVTQTKQLSRCGHIENRLYRQEIERTFPAEIKEMGTENNLY